MLGDVKTQVTMRNDFCGLTWQELIIELVKNEPQLYKKSHEDYANRDLKDSTWAKIAETMIEMGYTDIKGMRVGKLEFL